MVSSISGYLSGIAILLSFIPYIKDIFSNKTKPERSSWLIWTVLGMISFFSQFAKGASYSLIMSGAQVIGDLFIFLLAIKFGLGGLIKRDIYALIAACGGLVLWSITKEASFALLIAIIIDAIGAFLTVMKTYENPKTETVSSWALTFLGGLFGCIAVGNFNWILLVFPIYICLASLSILLAIKFGLSVKTRTVI